jgi:tRNA U34 2-thiouridine synthase MnmA/TrmU
MKFAECGAGGSLHSRTDSAMQQISEVLITCGSMSRESAASSRQAAVCEIEQADQPRLEVALAATQWAATPGQAAVLSQSKVSPGRGIIVGLHAIGKFSQS